MKTVNGSGYEMATCQAIDRNGRVFLVAVVKGTFDIPEDPGQQPTPSPQQVPVHTADQFAGEPGLSATLVECDFALRKRKCDVVVVADAYAPAGKAVRELQVGFEFADRKKFARIAGPRMWVKSGRQIVTGESGEFISAPVTYGQSYGGMWLSEDKQVHECYEANPIGTGYVRKDPTRLEGTPAPTVEAPDQPIHAADQTYPPWGFGPVGRNCQPRIQYAGTYDQHWQDEVFPLQPADFDDRFYQCVPEDQQFVYPVGGERVVLHNLHPERPRVEFQLPNDLSMPMVMLSNSGKQVTATASVDTVVIEPGKNRFSLTWRARMSLQRSIREANMIAAGHVCKKWWAAQVYGETGCSCDGIDPDVDRIASLSELI